ncbi:hypothetical protein E2562_026560 [Oryza meyeriana var. granulata]|uniref:Uncharacterized protein n=1 Tax=Oryza meyeriana var. granulata TaxID=110450 RepID=A0A6G1CTQ8_9ORYZ|nr:hypothetical protein E2562_026560 [Oryza meyeriana var. granulata]
MGRYRNCGRYRRYLLPCTEVLSSPLPFHDPPHPAGMEAAAAAAAAGGGGTVAARSIPAAVQATNDDAADSPVPKSLGDLAAMQSGSHIIEQQSSTVSDVDFMEEGCTPEAEEDKEPVEASAEEAEDVEEEVGEFVEPLEEVIEV